MGAARAESVRFPFVIGYTLAVVPDRDFAMCTGKYIHVIIITLFTISFYQDPSFRRTGCSVQHIAFYHWLTQKT